MPRAQLALGRTCSNACVFCAAPDAALGPGSLDAAVLDAQLRELAAGGARGVTFGGGEPTLEPDRLLEAVRAARAAGLAPVGVQTNGHGLAPIARALADAGLADVHLSLHGPTAAAHDYHTGRAGSFATLWDAAAAARAAGLRVVVTTLLTRSSFRQISELPTLLVARGVSAWHVAVPLARGRAAEDFDRVYPRLAMALPFALHALTTAARLGLPAYVGGAPACLLGPLASRAIPLPEPSGARAFHAKCEGCAARPVCAGVDPLYLARFDGDELRARDDLPRDARAEPDAGAFVGPGELAPARARATHEPAQASRRALPMYGRPKRGAQEASTRATKSGDALREILPGLFEHGPERKEEH